MLEQNAPVLQDRMRVLLLCTIPIKIQHAAEDCFHLTAEEENRDYTTNIPISWGDTLVSFWEKKSVLCLMWPNERIFMTSFDLYPWIKTILDSIFSKTPWMGVNALRQARSQNQNLVFERAETKTNKSSFCRKMRHEVTLKSEILSQLDFKSAAQDVVFNCLDGQVCLRCVWIWDLLLM